MKDKLKIVFPNKTIYEALRDSVPATVGSSLSLKDLREGMKSLRKANDKKRLTPRRPEPN